MSLSNLLDKIKRKTKQISRRGWIIGGISATLVMYGLIFFIPKSVEFSYAGQTCVGQLSLFPGIQKQSGGSGLSVELEGVVSLGSFDLFSTKACVQPQKGFVAGSHSLSMSPWAGPFFAKKYRVEVAEAPNVVANTIAPKQSISVVRPLEITLTQEDKVHAYSISALGRPAGDDTVAPCRAEEGAPRLSCDTAQLKLSHNQEYELELKRDIPDVTTSHSIAKFDVTTLTPVHIVTSSIKPGQTVYDKPNKLVLTADAPLEDTEVTLVRKSGDTSEAAPVKVSVEGTKSTVYFEKELTRKSQYSLTVTQLIAKNGASLAKPYTVQFSTSGGPKVKSVSAPTAGISSYERIIVTFDQPIDNSVDITKFAHVLGASAKVEKLSSTKLSYSLRGASLCAAISISLDKGIKSGSNGVTSDEAWRFNTRVACGTSSVIGYSVRGRPITAYYFGSGATTLLFTGGIHGSEPSGQATMQAWVNYLMVNGNIIPAGKRVVVVPNTNPDAIATGSRNNARNVNIGRNFPSANWKADIETTSGPLENGGGAYAGSEPETRALMALTRQLRPRLEVSFHAQGSLVGANKYGDSVAVGDLYASTVGYQTMFYNAEAVMGYPITGEYEEWMGEEMGKAAILIELPSPYGNYLSSQLPALLKLLRL